MFDIDSITSQEIQTLEDEISGNFCECGDLAEEHFTGDITGITKCYGLNNNGTVWSSCNCSLLRIIPFKIVVTVKDYANNS